MHLPRIDQNLADLVKLMNEINEINATRNFPLMKNKLEKVKAKIDAIYSMLKNAIDAAIIDNRWIFVGHTVTGAGVGVGVSYVITACKGTALTIKGALKGGGIGAIFGIITGGVSYFRNSNRIESESKSMNAFLKMLYS